MVAACGRRLLCRSSFAAGAPPVCPLRQPLHRAANPAVSAPAGGDWHTSQCREVWTTAADPAGRWTVPGALGCTLRTKLAGQPGSRAVATSAAVLSGGSRSDRGPKPHPPLPADTAGPDEERRRSVRDRTRRGWDDDDDDDAGDGPMAERRRFSRGATAPREQEPEGPDGWRPGGRLLQPRGRLDRLEGAERRTSERRLGGGRSDRDRAPERREGINLGGRRDGRTAGGPRSEAPAEGRRVASAEPGLASHTVPRASSAARGAPAAAAATTPDGAGLPRARSQSQGAGEAQAQAQAGPRGVERVALPEGVYPTYVPRNPGIQDGDWNARDVAMVRRAQRDAAAVMAAQDVFDPKGAVLLGQELPALEQLAAHYGQPRFRAKQLRDGLLNGAHSVEEISTIPKQWRAQLLADGVRTGRSLLHHSVGDEDGTRKFLLQLHDGRIIETVGIPTEDRLTVCVSSQVGCPMRCTFCATGKGGFARNLAPHEILDQVLTVQEQFGRRVSNVVFMGMGEPLLNLQSVIHAYHGLNQQIGIGGAFITISTVGVPNAISRLASAQLKATLAVSLHAPNQELREAIIPSAKAYPLQALMGDCAAYFRSTGRRVTFEYTLLSGVNDEPTHAAELTTLLQRYNLMSHVNIIPWNPVDDSEFQRPSRNCVFAFKRAVEAAGLACTVRETRGLEAAAACGQLRNQFQKTPLPQFEVPR